MTTFDWYLLRRYLQLFFIFFLSAYGLYVVIDGFSNVDEYQKAGEGTLSVLARMGRYYFLQISVFFEMVGTIISVISVMTVFALLYKKSEIQPILAAGVPLYRLTRPFVIGTIFLNGLLIANQEFVMPRIAFAVAARDTEENKGHPVEPVYDYKTHLHVDGYRLFIQEQRMTGAKFVLSVPELADELTTVKAEEATWLPATGTRPAGWLLKNATPDFETLPLNEAGKKLVRAVRDSTDVFVITDVNMNQLFQRNRSFKTLSTPELISRINNPAYGSLALQNQTQHLHARLTRPFVTLISIFIVVPMIIRKETRNLITNMAWCTTLLIGAMLLTYVFEYLGSKHYFTPDLAAWLPLMICGAVAAWLSGVAQS